MQAPKEKMAGIGTYKGDCWERYWPSIGVALGKVVLEWKCFIINRRFNSLKLLDIFLLIDFHGLRKRIY